MSAHPLEAQPSPFERWMKGKKSAALQSGSLLGAMSVIRARILGVDARWIGAARAGRDSDSLGNLASRDIPLGGRSPAPAAVSRDAASGDGFPDRLVLILGFVSEFSSLATFAGFITAGIAVGLQAVLLSVAAYFFIIGRYGIRVGDRISVTDIQGDVVDIGLVRMYVLELAGTGLDFYPTGRLVAFSNSVLFQTGTPLFKQIPGTEYSWHEVVVMIAPGGNHKETEERLTAAVNDVYSKYQAEIERQHATIERRVDIQVHMPRPETRPAIC